MKKYFLPINKVTDYGECTFQLFRRCCQRDIDEKKPFSQIIYMMGSGHKTLKISDAEELLTKYNKDGGPCFLLVPSNPEPNCTLSRTSKTYKSKDQYAYCIKVKSEDRGSDSAVDVAHLCGEVDRNLVDLFSAMVPWGKHVLPGYAGGAPIAKTIRIGESMGGLAATYIEALGRFKSDVLVLASSYAMGSSSARQNQKNS